MSTLCIPTTHYTAHYTPRTPHSSSTRTIHSHLSTHTTDTPTHTLHTCETTKTQQHMTHYHLSANDSPFVYAYLRPTTNIPYAFTSFVRATMSGWLANARASWLSKGFTPELLSIFDNTRYLQKKKKKTNGYLQNVKINMNVKASDKKERERYHFTLSIVSAACFQLSHVVNSGILVFSRCNM